MMADFLTIVTAKNHVCVSAIYRYSIPQNRKNVDITIAVSSNENNTVNLTMLYKIFSRNRGKAKDGKNKAR